MLARIHPWALLVLRVTLGIVFIAHGWFKISTLGMDGTAAFFADAGIPLGSVAAYAVTALELLGGIALILGALLPVFGVLLALNMLGALWFVHLPAGFFVDAKAQGYEFVLVLAVACLAIGTTNGGALSVDGKVPALRSSQRQPAAAAQS